MPIPWAGIGGLAAGLGSMMSGVSGFLGDDQQFKNKNMYHEQDVRRAIKHKLKYSREFGEQYGFHPLAALGMQAAVPQGKIVGGTGRQRGNFQDLGHGVAKLIDSLVRLNDAKADKIVEGQSSTVTSEQLPMSHPSYASGEQRGKAVQPLEQLYRTGNTIVAMPAEGAQDFMSESFFAMAPYAAKQIGQFMGTGRGSYPGKTIKEFRDKLNRVEDFLRSHNEIRPDEYLAWSHDSGQLVVMRSTGLRKKLFVGRSRKYKQQPDRYAGMYFRKN